MLVRVRLLLLILVLDNARTAQMKLCMYAQVPSVSVRCLFATSSDACLDWAADTLLQYQVTDCLK